MVDTVMGTTTSLTAGECQASDRSREAVMPAVYDSSPPPQMPPKEAGLSSPSTETS